MSNGRCVEHGGFNRGTPMGNTYYRQHGIYSTVLTDEEKALWDDLQVGKLDDSIKMCMLQIRRALIAKMKAEEGEQAWIKEEVVETFGDDVKTRTVRRHPDFDSLIEKFMGRLGSLERTRFELMAGEGLSAQDVANRIRNELDKLEQTDGTHYEPLD